MTDRMFRWMDAAVIALLLLWTGMALGISAFAAPAAFTLLPSRELAGLVLGACFRAVDVAAWIAFALAFLLSYGSRWFSEVKDTGHGIGPLRLWNAAVVAALLMCFASSAIVTPKLEAVRSRVTGPIDNLPPGSPDRAAFGRAHSLSTQLMVLRMLLALGLAAGVTVLPKRKDASEG